VILTFAAAAFLLAWVLGGNPKRLADLDFQRLPFLLASFVLRDGAEELLDREPPQIWVSMLLALACYGLLFYGLKANAKLPGMRAVGLGSAMNLVVVLLNQGRMPVSVSPLSADEQVLEVARLYTSVNHRLIGQETRFTFLADLFKWSFLQHRPTMFSVGDVLITAGVAYLIFRGSLDGFRPFRNDGRMGTSKS